MAPAMRSRSWLLVVAAVASGVALTPRAFLRPAQLAAAAPVLAAAGLRGSAVAADGAMAGGTVYNMGAFEATSPGMNPKDYLGSPTDQLADSAFDIFFDFLLPYILGFGVIYVLALVFGFVESPFSDSEEEIAAAKEEYEKSKVSKSKKEPKEPKEFM